MTDEAKRMALLNAIANATHHMGERTSAALAVRLKWTLSEVTRVIAQNHTRPFVTHADAQHQYSLTPLGWAAVDQKPPLHMENAA